MLNEGKGLWEVLSIPFVKYWSLSRFSFARGGAFSLSQSVYPVFWGSDLALKMVSLIEINIFFTNSLQGENQVLRNSYAVVGTASLNLAEYASSYDGNEIPISLPLNVRGSTAAELSPLLLVSFNTLQLQQHLHILFPDVIRLRFCSSLLASWS